MTFASPWVLWFLVIPVAWAVWEWRRTYRSAGVLLKSAVFAFVILALAEPRLTTFETKMAVAVLADSSPSIPDEQIEQMRETIQSIAGARDNNQVRVFLSTGRLGRDCRLRSGRQSLPLGRISNRRFARAWRRFPPSACRVCC